jgi:alpha-methylacyl-CoA racemase
VPGPLAGASVIELAGLGPVPFAAMLLADLGADVVRVDRPGTATANASAYAMHRGRRSVAVDLKQPEGRDVVLRLVDRADALLEGHRPGVMERLGLGPEDCLARNPRLVYGRMTGWGQDGPLALTAGHDIDYIALSGALGACARRGERPLPPVNMIGDFGGGGMFLAFGVVAAMWEMDRSGAGQVVDAAMIDGSAVLTTMMHGLMAQGRWRDEAGVNFADTGSPYYEVYECGDGRFVGVGAIEGPFYDELLRVLGLARADLPDRRDEASWPVLKERFADVFRTRTRDEWAALFAGSDACVAPVLSLTEAPRHPHNVARETFVVHGGVVQPAPAPRFSRTPNALGRTPPPPGDHTGEVLAELGYGPDEISRLNDMGAVRSPPEGTRPDPRR